MVVSENDDSVSAALHDKTALVSVVGRGSYRQGPALKRFGHTAVDEGCNLIVYDMARCISMDSTFMGVIAGVAMRLGDNGNGKSVMLNLSAKTLSLLETLGLDRLLECHSQDDAGAPAVESLADMAEGGQLQEEADKKDALETMLDAHRDLVKVSPENLPKFEHVIDYLGRDLKRLEDV